MQIVPQYIDVEDRVAGPFTWKHLGWFFGGGAIAMLAYLFLDTSAFIMAAIPIIIITALLAFYKPNGVSFSTFLSYGFIYLFHPKTYVWKREVMKQNISKNSKKQKTADVVVNKNKKISIDDIESLAKALDTRGRERNERLQQILKERINNN